MLNSTISGLDQADKGNGFVQTEKTAMPLAFTAEQGRGMHTINLDASLTDLFPVGVTSASLDTSQMSSISSIDSEESTSRTSFAQPCLSSQKGVPHLRAHGANPYKRPGTIGSYFSEGGNESAGSVLRRSLFQKLVTSETNRSRPQTAENNLSSGPESCSVTIKGNLMNMHTLGNGFGGQQVSSSTVQAKHTVEDLVVTDTDTELLLRRQLLELRQSHEHTVDDLRETNEKLRLQCQRVTGEHAIIMRNEERKR
jgi:hypothetical protein